MSINTSIIQLVDYAIDNNLIEEEDRVYTINQVISLLNIKSIEIEKVCKLNYTEIVESILDYANENNIIENNFTTTRDLFESKLMNIFIDRPSNIISRFNMLNEKSSNSALEYYYNIALKSNYIKSDRIAKNVSFKHDTEYGEIEITINLSKPEKDPREIAMAKASTTQSTNYPKCLLCMENEGYSGHDNHPGRHEHRIIPIRINDEDWFFQYSPYAYYNEHCIVFNKKHTPMQINKATFKKIIDFVSQFREYFCGSNADLPIVGGSILSHDHFQGGRHIFPMDLATSLYKFQLKQYSNTTFDILKWPLSVLRLTSKDEKELIEVADYVLGKWIDYNDHDNEVYSHTNGERHNTITPICRYNSEKEAYELDLALRNNRTTEERPFGLYHPRNSVHHIKRENIGLIEVMGLAILPGRLKSELEEISSIIISNEELPDNLMAHKEWVDQLKEKYEFNATNVHDILNKEVGDKFKTCLEDAGVFKNLEAFKKFTNIL